MRKNKNVEKTPEDNAWQGSVNKNFGAIRELSAQKTILLADTDNYSFERTVHVTDMECSPSKLVSVIG